jgi:hypothetical protein
MGSIRCMGGDNMKRRIIHSILSFFTNSELLEQLELRKKMK